MAGRHSREWVIRIHTDDPTMLDRLPTDAAWEASMRSVKERTPGGPWLRNNEGHEHDDGGRVLAAEGHVAWETPTVTEPTDG
jgi:hypothetical protein